MRNLGRVIGFLFLCLLALGCGSSSGNGPEPADTSDNTDVVDTNQTVDVPDTSGPLASLGDPCQADEDCETPSGFATCITTKLIQTLGLDVEAEVPSGYCSDMTCKASTDCGEENVQCVDLAKSDVIDLFNICLLGCAEGDSSGCGTDSQCYCDDTIYNTEGANDFCTCIPEAIIQLLTD